MTAFFGTFAITQTMPISAITKTIDSRFNSPTLRVAQPNVQPMPTASEISATSASQAPIGGPWDPLGNGTPRD